MDLKEFVRKTLVQIATGVKDEQIDVRGLGGIVNSATQNPLKGGNSYFSSVDDLHHVFLVDFDVAVSVAENTGTNAQAKLNVATILSLGAGGSLPTPVLLPTASLSRFLLRYRLMSRHIQSSQERLPRTEQECVMPWATRATFNNSFKSKPLRCSA